MKRVLLGAVACWLAFAVIGGAWYWWENRPSYVPPLDGGDGIAYGQLLEVGQPFSWGSALLRNVGKKPVVVERARLLRSTPNLELLGEVRTHVVGVGEGEAAQMMLGDRSGFPSDRYPSRPLREQNVVALPKTLTPDGTPGEGLQIVFGLRIPEPGAAGGSDVEVTYRVGGHRYRAVYNYSVYLCAPEAAYKDNAGCRPEDVDGKLVNRALG